MKAGAPRSYPSGAHRRVHEPAAGSVLIHFPAMNESPLDEVIVQMPCYEPNSFQLQLTGDMLTQHVMVTGASGYGKTTLLNRVLNDVIRYRGREPASKIGLLIFDFKADDTVARVTEWARACGRADDVVVVSSGSEYYLNLVGGVVDFADLETVCAKLGAFKQLGQDNEFWESARHTYLETALYLAAFRHPQGGFEDILGFLNQYLVTHETCAVLEIEDEDILLSYLQRIAADHEHRFSLKARSILSNHEGWKTLDCKTRSNLSAIFSSTLQPFLTMASQGLFSARPAGKKHALDLERCMTEGKIVILSVDAMNHPELAQAAGMMLKCDFFRTVMKRPEQRGSNQRLLGLFADEYPLVVTGKDPRFGDITQLQTMRSRGAFLVAATQGLVNIDIRIGQIARRALTVNFGTWLMLHSNEPELDVFALYTFGERPLAERQHRTPPEDWLAPAEPQEVRLVPVCPLGALGRLEKHQAFVALADGFRTPSPYWLEPLFCPSTSTPSARPDDPVSLERLRAELHERIRDVLERNARARAELEARSRRGPGVTDDEVPF